MDLRDLAIGRVSTSSNCTTPLHDAGPDPRRGAYKTILLTACRPGEVLGLRWEEISEDGHWWVLPEARSKNGLAHRVFLTPPMRQILQERRASTGTSPLVFPKTRDGSALLRFQAPKLCKSL